jgi:transcriptional regulator with XRE-family HTH domain
MASEPRNADAVVLVELGTSLARHRVQRGLTQVELANRAGVSLRTVIRLEAGASTQLTNLVRVLRVLGLLDNLRRLAPPPPPSPIEQLAVKRKERQRVRRSPRRPHGSDRDRGASGGWRWGDREGQP